MSDGITEARRNSKISNNIDKTPIIYTFCCINCNHDTFTISDRINFKKTILECDNCGKNTAIKIR